MPFPTIESAVLSSSPLMMIVDDDVTMSLMMSRFWRKENFRTIVVENGHQALVVCEDERPDIILLDAVMPEMDGYRCCEQLQSRYGRECPPILMITELHDSDWVDRAFSVGVTDYIVKPFHWSVFRHRVFRILKKYQAERQLYASLEAERQISQELRQVNQKLSVLSAIDGLTNLTNRRVFDERLEREWKRLHREQSELSLLLIDVDYFKSYNDHHGHVVGDRCLQTVGHLLKQVARRPADVSARYGGDEFAILLPKTPQEGAVFVANSLRSSLEAEKISHPLSSVKPFVTFSIGAATLVPTSSSAGRLVKDADRALYGAKAEGRDCVVSLSGVEY